MKISLISYVIYKFRGIYRRIPNFMVVLVLTVRIFSSVPNPKNKGSMIAISAVNGTAINARIHIRGTLAMNGKTQKQWMSQASES